MSHNEQLTEFYQRTGLQELNAELDDELNITPDSTVFTSLSRLNEEPIGEDFLNRIRAIVGEASPDCPSSQLTQGIRRGGNGELLTTTIWLLPEPKVGTAGTMVAVVHNKDTAGYEGLCVNSGYVIFDDGRVRLNAAIESPVPDSNRPLLFKYEGWLDRVTKIELYKSLAEFYKVD